MPPSKCSVTPTGLRPSSPPASAANGVESREMKPTKAVNAMMPKFPIPTLVLLPFLAFGDTLSVAGRKIVSEPAQFFPEQIFGIPGGRDSFIAGHLKDQSGTRPDFYVQKIGPDGEPLGQGRIALPFVEDIANMASIVR